MQLNHGASARRNWKSGKGGLVVHDVHKRSLRHERTAMCYPPAAFSPLRLWTTCRLWNRNRRLFARKKIIKAKLSRAVTSHVCEPALKRRPAKIAILIAIFQVMLARTLPLSRITFHLTNLFYLRSSKELFLKRLNKSHMYWVASPILVTLRI